MAVPIRFTLEDGSTTWLTLHNQVDDDGDLVVRDTEDLKFGMLVDLLTAVMNMPRLNTLYRVFAERRPGYIVRLEDNSILISTSQLFLPSRWLAINSENMLAHRGELSLGNNSLLIFKHIIDGSTTVCWSFFDNRRTLCNR